MEERDSLRTILYGWARLGLYWLISVFASIIGKTAVLGVVGTLLPRLALYDNPETLAFISWLIVLAFLIPLFWDDGRRHTAYGLYNPVAVTITLILTGITYYAPVFLIDYAEDLAAKASLLTLYFTDSWLSVLNDDPQIYALIGTVINIVLALLAYFIANKVYRGKYADEEIG